MSKLIAQGFLSLLISLGLVTGARPDVRGEVKELWQETKAVVHEAFEFTTDTVGEVTSQVPTEVSVDLNLSAEANAYTSADVSSNDVQAEAGSETNFAISADADSEGGFFLNLGGDADTLLDLGVFLGK